VYEYLVYFFNVSGLGEMLAVETLQIFLSGTIKYISYTYIYSYMQYIYIVLLQERPLWAFTFFPEETEEKCF